MTGGPDDTTEAPLPPVLSAQRREALAQDHVLVVLDAVLDAAVRRRAETDPDLAAAIDGWEARLADLSAALPDVPPPPALWSRIDASLSRDARPENARAPAVPPLRRLVVWRGATALAAAAAVLFAVLALRPPAVVEEGPLAVLLHPQARTPAFVVLAEAPGAVRITRLVAGADTGRAQELWTLRDAAEGPRSLGLLPPDRTVVVRSPLLASLSADQLFEVTSEPPGGSPTGRPTGPILGVGRLSATP